MRLRSVFMPFRLRPHPVAVHMACVAAVLAGAWWWHLNRAPVVNLPPVILPSPNGYTRLAAAARLLVRPDDIKDAVSKPGKDASGRTRKVFTDAQKAELAAANRPALDAAYQALGLGIEVPTKSSFWDDTSDEKRLRQLARAYVLTGKVYETRGNFERAGELYQAAIREGIELSDGPVITRLVGISCESLGRRSLLDLADRISLDQAKEEILRLDCWSFQRPGLDKTFAAEKRDTQAGLADVYARWNVLEAPWYLKIISQDKHDVLRPWQEQAKVCASLLTVSKQDVLKANARYMDAMTTWSNLPRPFDVPAPAVPSDPMNGLFASGYENVVHRDLDNRTGTALLLVKLALRAYYLSRGTYPATTYQLEREGFLYEDPADPFAPTYGNPFHYRKTKTGYLLYSVGPDGKDDGGRPINNRYADGTYKPWMERDSKGDVVLGVNL